jgi:penicillin-binding protein 2
VLTIDLGLQQATEAALRSVGPNTRSAAVVLNPNNGDIWALASSPAFDPNQLVPRISREEWEKLNDPHLRPLLNRAIYGSYPPGSIFKIVVALAGLEAGLDPHENLTVQPDPSRPTKGCFFVGRRRVQDTAPPGDYDFKRAFLVSCNSYFIHHGLATGLENILRIGQRLHLGERTDVLPFQEVAGFFPTQAWKQKKIVEPWRDGDTANLCIGQGFIAVTPLQMAVMTAAIANGGKVFWPRLVERFQPQDPASEESPVVFPMGRVRDDLGVSTRTMEIVRAAMLADVEDADGTGKEAFVRGIRVCGKTGTAQIKHGSVTVDHITWFVSFAPYENPRYVVVVMVESGGSGGGTCAPVARKIYEAIRNREIPGKPKSETMAQSP